jgi:cysteine desulfurase
VSPITAHGASTSSPHSNAPLDFQSTDGLSQSTKDALAKAFESASLEPQKIHHRSAQLRQLLHEARESIAANLKVPVENLEFVGELGFAYWAAISGALKNFSGSFIHGITDRQVVHAFGREFAQTGNRTLTLTTDKSGNLPYESALEESFSRKQPVVVCWQAANRETGVVQKEIGISLPKNSMLVADMTAAVSLSQHPSEYCVALWDPRIFGAPEGLAILAINPESNWRSPIPQIDKRRLFGAFSKPLLLLTAIALEEWRKNEERNLAHLRELNSALRAQIKNEIEDVEIVGDPANANPRSLAIVARGVVAEEILRAMEKREILIDAGSACGAGALSPSHVLEAMGFGDSGHLRITIRASHSIVDLNQLVSGLKEEIERFRAD